MAGVLLQGVKKTFGETPVIHEVDLTVEDGEFVVFVGPSGCGKSTLLRMISGLEDVSGGQIAIDGRDVTHTAPADRGIAMVFQSYALYPHMTVWENMAFGLRMAKKPANEIKRRVMRAAEILHLEPYLQRTLKQLSGGQRQRVAIGRAIVRNPQVFLFDEPLSNLDAELRVQMRLEIAKLHRDLGATMIYVTHDQTEAMTLADKIVVLRGGNVEQIGAPMTLYDDPDNLFVAGFIGSPRMNFFDGTVGEVGRIIAENNIVFTPHFSGQVPAVGTKVKVGIRPEHFGQSDASTNASLTIRADMIENLGAARHIHWYLSDDNSIIVERRESHPIKLGENFNVGYRTDDLRVFDTNGKRIR